MNFHFAVQMDLPQQPSETANSSSTKGKVLLFIWCGDSIFSTIYCQKINYCGFTSYSVSESIQALILSCGLAVFFL